jgi:hypothetical protein
LRLTHYRHPSMLVEVDRLVDHDEPHVCAAPSAEMSSSYGLRGEK